ncbi:MAG TPA: sigma-70 family RNA polymerase sigma factor [Longimicrobiales bacterium]
MTDALLVERVRRGEVEAYGELVRRHMRRAFSIAYRIVRHREDAEDVVQDAFVRALERLDTLKRGRPFHPWFYRIVVNRALSCWRSRAVRAAEAVPEEAVGDSTPEGDAERSELRRRLAEALDALPESERIVVQLSELDGLTSAEIAEILGEPAGTVRYRLHQARRRLRAALAPLGREEE